jgi:lantibiotic modifying enzyme
MAPLPPVTPWRSLLDGPRRDLVRSTATRIAAQLPTALDQLTGPSVGRGAAGAALAFSYLAETLPGQGHEERADALLSRAIDALAETELPPTLYGGYAGVAFVYDLVADRLHGEPPDPDAMSEIDEGLAEHLGVFPSPMSHELIGGFAGMALYALGRADDAAHALLRRILEVLEIRAEYTAEGLTWVTTPFMQRHWSGGANAPHSYNLGVSHGIPGTIAALAGMLAAGIEPERTRPLLKSSARWLVAQIRPEGPSGLGYAAGEGPGARLAWCYGDLGVATTLIWIARVLDDEPLFEAARALGARAAARSAEDSGVIDAGLCHGAAGNAHCFNRLWQETQDPRFAEAANAWLDRAIAFGGADAELGGFAGRDVDGKLGDPAAFLEGSVGVMAALAAACSDVEPRWDRVLLASRPRANRGPEASP